MNNTRLYIFAVLLAVYFAVAPSSAKPGSAPGTNGSYNLVFAGTYSGTGKLTVGGGKITGFTGTLKDEETGATGSFSLSSLPVQLDNGRFSATGTAIGKPVTICGRVEPKDPKIVKKARVVCTFSSGTGDGTRVYGSM